jgi:hypothetical protein
MLKTLFFSYIVAVLSGICSYADTDARSVGHLNDSKGEVAAAANIVLAKFTNVKGSGAASMLGTLYHGNIKILQVLKGDASGNVEVGFSVIQGPKDTEVEPNLTDIYIIVLAGHHEIRKLLPATDDNIAKVKALIAAAPAGK